MHTHLLIDFTNQSKKSSWSFGFGEVNKAVYSLSLSSPNEEHLDKGLRGLINDNEVSVKRCLYLLQANWIATADQVLQPGE